MTASGSRDPFARYRERLAALGFRPSRHLGQNFLLDPSLHRAVVDAAGIEPADIVLEVGGGLGFLTRELVARAAHVLVAEIDPRLVTLLREDYGANAKVEIVPGDALGPADSLAPALEAAIASACASRPGARLCVAANLPYAAAGPLLVALAVREGGTEVASAAVLVQSEVAERMTAATGTKAYGSLPALLQTLFELELERRVGREVFRPRPQVDSAIVSLRARPGVDPRLAGRRVLFARFVRALFLSRRKTLRHAFDRLILDWRDRPELLSRAALRAEQLDPPALVELFATLEAFGGALGGEVASPRP